MLKNKNVTNAIKNYFRDNSLAEFENYFKIPFDI